MAFTDPSIHGVLSITAEVSSVTPCVILKFAQERIFIEEAESARLDIYFHNRTAAERFAAAINSVNAKAEEKA